MSASFRNNDLADYKKALINGVPNHGPTLHLMESGHLEQKEAYHAAIIRHSKIERVTLQKMKLRNLTCRGNFRGAKLLREHPKSILRSYPGVRLVRSGDSLKGGQPK